MPLAAHPFIFFVLFSLGAAELGIAAYLESRYEDTRFPSEEFKNRLRFLLFCGAWTVLLGLAHLLVNLGVGGFLVLLTIIFWAVGAGLWHHHHGPFDCDGAPIVSTCRQLSALEGIAWAALGVSVLALAAIIFHIGGPRRYRSSARGGFYD